MPTIFPGMDPYLEGHLWPDVHLGLAFVIKEQLVPKVSPNYLVQTEIYTVKDTFPEEDVGIMYPDIEILHKTKQAKEPEEAYQSSSIIIPTPPTISVSSISAIEVRIPVLEIRDQKSNQLITAIEILSPVNKRNPGLKPYRKKRIKLLESGVHLLEIDLLRRGKRPFTFPNTPQSHYWITLVRADTAKTDIWAFNIQDVLPVVPVPLKNPDQDVLLDLKSALQTLYRRSRYDLAINYQESPPPPVFSKEDQLWMHHSINAYLQQLND